MRLITVSTVVLIVATCGVTPGAPPADVVPTGDAMPADLPAYMEQMSALVDRCREAATLADEGRPDEAIRLLREADRPGLSVTLMWWVRQHADELERVRDHVGPRRRLHDTEIAWLWCLDMGRPDLTAELFEQRLRKADVARDGHSLGDVQLAAGCWAVAGRYGRAREVLDAFLKQEVTPSAREWVVEQRESLEGLREDEPMTVPLFRKLRDAKALPHGLRPTDVVRLWETPAADDAEQVEKVKLLIDMFDGDGGGPDELGERLALQWLADRRNAPAPDAADALLVLANKAYAARRYDEAAELWRRVEREWPNTPAWGKAAFNLGLDLKRQRKHDDAIAQFGRLLAGNVDDREAGAHVMETYRNYRPRAQWEVGECLLAKGDAAGALEAFRTVPRKYPFQTWCGNERHSIEYRQTFYEGLCLEHLGRHAEAAANYYRATADATFSGGTVAALRLVELYAAAGQLADLRRVVADEDARRARANALPLPLPLRELLALRELEAAADWAGLAARVTMGGSSGGAVARQNREGNYRAVEAGRLLARHADEAVPHLVKRLGADGGRHDEWLWYALGLCGTPEALTALKEQVATDRVANSWVAASLAHALSLTGEPGRAVLAEVVARAKQNDDRGRLGNLRIVAERLLAGEGEADKDVDAPTFPAVPQGLRLPADPRPAPGGKRAAASTATPPLASADSADSGSKFGSSVHRPAVVAGAAVLGVGLTSFWRTRRRRQRNASPGRVP